MPRPIHGRDVLGSLERMDAISDEGLRNVQEVMACSDAKPHVIIVRQTILFIKQSHILKDVSADHHANSVDEAPAGQKQHSSSPSNGVWQVLTLQDLPLRID